MHKSLPSPPTSASHLSHHLSSCMGQREAQVHHHLLLSHAQQHNLGFLAQVSGNGPACRKVTPTVAVDDPLLLLGMPKGLTAATGMDALSHAMEAYVSTASTPVTDAFALHVNCLMSSYLRLAVLHSNNLKARDMMRYSPTHTWLFPLDIHGMGS